MTVILQLRLWRGARGGLDESKVSKVYRGRKEPLIISHSFDINSLSNHQLLHLNINTKLLFSQPSLHQS
jgi:hypothetical protein